MKAQGQWNYRLVVNDQQRQGSADIRQRLPPPLGQAGAIAPIAGQKDIDMARRQHLEFDPDPDRSADPRRVKWDAFRWGEVTSPGRQMQFCAFRHV